MSRAASALTGGGAAVVRERRQPSYGVHMRYQLHGEVFQLFQLCRVSWCHANRFTVRNPLFIYLFIFVLILVGVHSTRVSRLTRAAGHMLPCNPQISPVWSLSCEMFRENLPLLVLNNKHHADIGYQPVLSIHSKKMIATFSPPHI